MISTLLIVGLVNKKVGRGNQWQTRSNLVSVVSSLPDESRNFGFCYIISGSLLKVDVRA